MSKNFEPKKRTYVWYRPRCATQQDKPQIVYVGDDWEVTFWNSRLEDIHISKLTGKFLGPVAPWKEGE